MPANASHVEWITSPGKLVGLKPFRRIQFDCPDCMGSMSMPERDAAKRGRCPDCGRLLFTPDPKGGMVARMPGFSSPGVVPEPRGENPDPKSNPAVPGNLDDEQAEDGVAEETSGGEGTQTTLAYQGLLFRSGEGRIMGDIEEEWSEDDGAKHEMAKLRNPRALDATGPWLGITVAIGLLAAGASPYLFPSETDPTSTEGEVADESLQAAGVAIAKLVDDFNARPPGPERVDLVRPVDGISAKMEAQEGRSPAGHQLVLADSQPLAAAPAADGARRVFIDGTTGVRRVRFLFEEISPSRWAIDWESAVGYCEQDWKQFADDPPDSPRSMRVVAITGDYFNDEFRQDAGYLCVRLTDLHRRQELWGYARRSSAAGLRLAPWTDDGTAVTITLSLEFPPPDPDKPDRPRNQVWIRDVISPSWFVE